MSWRALRQRTKYDPKSLDCLRLCHKTIHTLQRVLPCQALWDFALFGSGKDTTEDLIWEHASKTLEKSPVLDYAIEAISLDSVRLIPYFIDVSFCLRTHPPTGMSVRDAFRINILHITMLS